LLAGLPVTLRFEVGGSEQAGAHEVFVFLDGIECAHTSLELVSSAQHAGNLTLPPMQEGTREITVALRYDWEETQQFASVDTLLVLVQREEDAIRESSAAEKGNERRWVAWRKKLQFRPRDELEAKGWRSAGYYRNKEADGKGNVVVLVVANQGYQDLLQHWMCHADRLGLKYMIGLADPEIGRWVHENHPEVQTHMLFEGSSMSEEGSFMSEVFYRIVWRCMELVRDLLDRSLSVLFVDIDVMLLADPAGLVEHNCDLVYQQNHCDGIPPREASEHGEPNAGFYFVRAGHAAKRFLNEVLLGKAPPPADAELNRKRFYSHDQRVQIHFWNRLRSWLADGRAKLAQVPRQRYEHRDLFPSKFCAADALAYATGWALDRERFEAVNGSLVALHAKCIIGKAKKVEMMRELGVLCF